MNLARLSAWIFNRGRKQERLIERVSQGYGCGNIAFQGGYDARNSSGLGIAIGNDGPHSQRNAYYPVQVGKAGRVLEIGNGQSYRGQLNIHPAQADHAGIQSVNSLYHRLAPWLKTRFGRSCRAFVNAWRAQ